MSLDETLARQLQEELIALVERSCVTSLLVTHDILEAARLVERVIVLDGRPARMVADLPIEVPRAQRSASFVSSIAERSARHASPHCDVLSLQEAQSRGQA